MNIDKKLKEFDEKFNVLDKDGIIWSKNHSIITVDEDNLNQLDVIKKFIKSSIQSAVKDALESTRLVKKELPDEAKGNYYEEIAYQQNLAHNRAVQTQQKLITKAIKSLTN